MSPYQNAFFTSSLLLLVLAFSLPSFGGEIEQRLPLAWETSPYLSLVAKRSASTSIRNIRAHQHKKYTRLVLDLDRDAQPASSDRRNDAEFQLELPNTRILKKALSKTTAKTFPIDLSVSRTAKGTLILSVPTKPWKRYKWYVLQNPPRIVLDLYPAPSQKPTVVKAPKPSKKPSVQPPVASKVPPPVIVAPPIAAVTKKEMIIVLDPGHGGKDPGALGRKGTREKDIVLKVSNHLRDLLAKQTNTKVFMTRPEGP